MQSLALQGQFDFPACRCCELTPPAGRASIDLMGETVINERDEPTAADLDAIEEEMPLIEAEMNLLAAETVILLADPEPTALDWRRMRRAEALVLRELEKLHNRIELPAEQAA